MEARGAQEGVLDRCEPGSPVVAAGAGGLVGASWRGQDSGYGYSHSEAGTVDDVGSGGVGGGSQEGGGHYLGRGGGGGAARAGYGASA